MAKLQISLQELIAFHKEFEQQMQKYDIVCKKGCSYCCYQWVPMMSFEVNYIKDAIKNLKPSVKKIVKEQYYRSMEHFCVNTPDRIRLTYDEVYKDYAMLVGRDWIPCPLMVDNECSIYDVRPFTCQLHFQLDSSELCKVNNLRNADERGLQLMTKLIKFLVSIGEFHLVPVLIVLKDIFDKKRKVKEIEVYKLK